MGTGLPGHRGFGPQNQAPAVDVRILMRRLCVSALTGFK